MRFNRTSVRSSQLAGILHRNTIKNNVRLQDVITSLPSTSNSNNVNGASTPTGSTRRSLVADGNLQNNVLGTLNNIRRNVEAGVNNVGNNAINSVRDNLQANIARVRDQIAAIDALRNRESAAMLSDIMNKIQAENAMVSSLIAAQDMDAMLQNTFEVLLDRFLLPHLKPIFDFLKEKDRMEKLAQLALRAKSPMQIGNELLILAMEDILDHTDILLDRAFNMIQNIRPPQIDFLGLNIQLGLDALLNPNNFLDNLIANGESALNRTIDQKINSLTTSINNQIDNFVDRGLTATTNFLNSEAGRILQNIIPTAMTVYNNRSLAGIIPLLAPVIADQFRAIATTEQFQQALRASIPIEGIVASNGTHAMMLSLTPLIASQLQNAFTPQILANAFPLATLVARDGLPGIVNTFGPALTTHLRTILDAQISQRTSPLIAALQAGDVNGALVASSPDVLRELRELLPVEAIQQVSPLLTVLENSRELLNSAVIGGGITTTVPQQHQTLLEILARENNEFNLVLPLALTLASNGTGNPDVAEAPNIFNYLPRNSHGVDLSNTSGQVTSAIDRFIDESLVRYSIDVGILNDITSQLQDQLANMALSLTNGETGDMGFGNFLLDLMLNTFGVREECAVNNAFRNSRIRNAFKNAVSINQNTLSSMGLEVDLNVPLPVLEDEQPSGVVENVFTELFGTSIEEGVTFQTEPYDVDVDEEDAAIRELFEAREPDIEELLYVAKQGFKNIQSAVDNINVADMLSESMTTATMRLDRYDVHSPSLTQEGETFFNTGLVVPDVEMPDPLSDMTAKLTTVKIQIEEYIATVSGGTAQLSTDIDSAIASLGGMCMYADRNPNCNICHGRGLTSALNTFRTLRIIGSVNRVAEDVEDDEVTWNDVEQTRDSNPGSPQNNEPTNVEPPAVAVALPGVVSTYPVL
jgi:hypothetical protein